MPRDVEQPHAFRLESNETKDAYTPAGHAVPDRSGVRRILPRAESAPHAGSHPATGRAVSAPWPLPAPPQAASAGLRSTLELLHTPLDMEPSLWRAAVTKSLTALLGADAAACLFWDHGGLTLHTDGLEPGAVDDYLEHFCHVDHGMQRRDALGLGLWCRQLLWERDALLRSEYFNEFAKPHRLFDSVGLSVDLDDVPAYLRIVLIFRRGPSWSEDPVSRLAVLQPVLPALRSALRMQLGFRPWLGLTSALLDKTGERTMVFSLDGRELYRSARLRRTLDEDPCRERLVERMRLTAQGIASASRTVPATQLSELHRLGSSRQDVEGASGRYRARACLIGREVLGAEAVVLVTLNRISSDPPSCDALHAQYGLTPREIDVARLLVQRMTNREIAAELGISTHTARHHTESVLLKTHVTSRRALRRLIEGERAGAR
jgi:DNA-binding CsgD family transcriptional regulator